MLPQLAQHAANRERILDLDEGPHMLGLRAAVERILFLIDGDALVIEKFGEGAIGKIEDVAAAHVERVCEDSLFRLLQLHHRKTCCRRWANSIGLPRRPMAPGPPASWHAHETTA